MIQILSLWFDTTKCCCLNKIITYGWASWSINCFLSVTMDINNMDQLAGQINSSKLTASNASAFCNFCRDSISLIAKPFSTQLSWNFSKNSKNIDMSKSGHGHLRSSSAYFDKENFWGPIHRKSILNIMGSRNQVYVTKGDQVQIFKICIFQLPCAGKLFWHHWRSK